jgi:Glycosyl transferase family 90
MDDIRPFWGMEPSEIRYLAAHLHEEDGHGITGIHIRNGAVWMINGAVEDGQPETLPLVMANFIRDLPDMDIAINSLDLPRVLVPWEDMQALLASEEKSRQILPEALDEWTTGMTGFWNLNSDKLTPSNVTWLDSSKQQYMDLAKEACSPKSPARAKNRSVSSAEYPSRRRISLIANFTRATDLCEMGPRIKQKHGLLFSPGKVLTSKRLLPVFGEGKFSVNNDILFPASVYWRTDKQYDYTEAYDLDWDNKKDIAIWRDTPSGGVLHDDNWREMHRQRLVMMLNGTEMSGKEVSIISQVPGQTDLYSYFHKFQPSAFALKYTDVGFTEPLGCGPNCSAHDSVWTYKKQMMLGEQFQNAFVVDIDGSSFSGRWRAILQSKSVGIKSTIFREWHDSRLFAWCHFVPLDLRFEEIYTILMYFIGFGSAAIEGQDGGPYVPRHDFESRNIARQGREWAAKALRKEDIEVCSPYFLAVPILVADPIFPQIYTYRLLIEYARVIDDNRDHIGYAGDGSEMDQYDSKHPWSGDY